MTAEKIIEELGITEDVIAILPYGSQVYGTANAQSDHDYIIVTKGATLASGAFKQNAISNKDYTIQGVLYSRSGFINALDDYEIGAMECASLEPDQIVLSTPIFEKFVMGKERKWDENTMIKKIIQKASASWHIADQQAKDGFKDRSKKGIYHALRILKFGIQLKEHQKIVDFSDGTEFKRMFSSIPDEEFDTRHYIEVRDQLMATVRGEDEK